MSPNTAERYTEELTGKNPVLEIAKYEAENTAYVRAVTPAFNEYSAALSTMWEDIRNGADMDTALERTVEQIDSASANTANHSKGGVLNERNNSHIGKNEKEHASLLPAAAGPGFCTGI